MKHSYSGPEEALMPLKIHDLSLQTWETQSVCSMREMILKFDRPSLYKSADQEESLFLK